MKHTHTHTHKVDQNTALKSFGLSQHISHVPYIKFIKWHVLICGKYFPQKIVSLRSCSLKKRLWDRRNSCAEGLLGKNLVIIPVREYGKQGGADREIEQWLSCKKTILQVAQELGWPFRVGSLGIGARLFYSTVVCPIPTTKI